MADVISEETLDSACEEIGNLSDQEGRSEIERLSKNQPALLAYVMASSEDLSTEAQEIALYMFVVLHKSFEKQFGKRLQNAGMKRIEQISDANMQAMDELIGHEEDIEEAAVNHSRNQPNLFRYVCEVLLEPEEDDVEMTEEDQGAITMIMKTVIDVLDSSVRDI